MYGNGSCFYQNSSVIPTCKKCGKPYPLGVKSNCDGCHTLHEDILDKRKEAKHK